MQNNEIMGEIFRTSTEGLFEGKVSQVHQQVTNWPPKYFWSKPVWGQPVSPLTNQKGSSLGQGPEPLHRTAVKLPVAGLGGGASLRTMNLGCKGC